MTEQGALADVVARVEQALAEIKTPSGEVVGLPKQLTEIVAQAGLQVSAGTIAFAGQYASGSYAVQYNDQNGGVRATTPPRAFALAKGALPGHKKESVGSHRDPLCFYLLFVLFFAFGAAGRGAR